MSGFLSFLFEFLLAFLVFLSETFYFIYNWAGRFIYLAFSATKIYEIIIISTIVGIVLFVMLRIGLDTAKVIFIIILMIFALIILMILV